MANCQSSSPHIAHSTCLTNRVVNLGTESHRRTPVYLSVPVGQAIAVPVLKRASTVSTNSDKSIDLSTRNTQSVCLKVGCFLQKRGNNDLCPNHYYREYQANYAKTPAAKAARALRNKTPAAKAARALHAKTPAAKAARALRNKTPAAKAARALRAKTPAAKAARALHAKTPAAKAARALQRKTPAAKAAKALRNNTPAAKAAKALRNNTPAAKAARALHAKTPAAKAARALQRKTPAAKAARAIKDARRYAYNKELAISGDETLANQKGDAAATRKELEAQKNQNVYQVAPPAFQSIN